MPTQKTILLVEDEALIAMNEAMLLRKEGYQVVHVYNGKDAINKVKATPRGIHLILMDINLGRGIDGTEAAQEILKEHDIPIIFLSSHTEPEVVDKTEKITSYGYVVKNTGITILLASIKMAFKLHTAHLNIRAQNQEIEAFNAALRQNIGRLRTITENASITILQVSRQGIIQFANQLVPGLSMYQVIGSSIYDWAPQENHSVLANALEGAFNRGERQEYELPGPSPDDEPRTYSVVVVPVVIDGQSDTAIYFATDITERKQTEDALKQLLQEKETLMKELQQRD